MPKTGDELGSEI